MRARRSPPVPQSPLDRLLSIMARLRDPERGCPWDVAQTFATVAPYTVEEAYEVADAIERGDMGDLREELGDLLLQVVFHSRMAEELGTFAFDDVAAAVADKMERRHPHVFGDAGHRDSSAQTVAWETQKAAERAAKGAERAGVLADVPAGLPAMTRAVKLTKRAARVGFDWTEASTVLAKLREEADELEAEIPGGDPALLREELGDLLFVCANLARKLDIDPEDALRGANAKFTRRFGHIEASLAADGRTPEQSDLAEMDALWNAAKALEKRTPLVIRRDDLSGPEVRELLALHLAGMHAVSPPDGVFALDLSGLQAPDVEVWTAWREGRIAGVAALRRLESGAGELKSMRTHPDHLRQGVARALLEHVIGEARAKPLRTLSLETGSGAEFEPALALYRARGFQPGPAFGGYTATAFNQFLHLKL